ncbi:hypothetical protein TD95_004682 [Thielaviopsis punctulata]|uniref:Methyltransferase domain-containing protein n=1 Tax=Thielaviopsis punctulata TaxID=72032 RepID=A0A0F4ZFW3_9PEZI|nr:hypothetical protein TD95_004682 [Thielaviopsis punctulata]
MSSPPESKSPKGKSPEIKSPAKSPKSCPTPSEKSEESGAQSPASESPQQLGPEGIEVDGYDDESGIIMGSVVTDTTSLRDSIMAYKFENNRRYYAFQDGAYYSPNDETQQRAEDLMHEMFTIILNGNYTIAEIPTTIQKALDIGTGTGMWAIDFADRYPGTEVVGVDLSPIQPHFVPPNCKFEVDDITREWTYGHNSLDLVHVRAMTGCVPDWVFFYKQAAQVLRSGGIIEHMELFGIAHSDDGSLKPDSPLVRWVREFRRIGDAMGKSFFFSDTMERDMQAVGLETTITKIKVPIGPWAKDPTLKLWGDWNRQFLLMGLEGFAMRGLTEALGYSYEDAQVFIAEVRAQIQDPKVHSYVYL